MILTDEQRAAVMHGKGNVLVSASAGSGKTFVMIQRLIRLILEGEAEVSDVLAVTFTKLAAAEMKEKLIRALVREINSADRSEEDRLRLKKQLGEVPSAAISTFHSYCNDLIKNYFYELGLDASFTIADETRAELLRAKAIDRVFERRYARSDTELNKLLSVYMRGRSDNNLRRQVLKIHKFFASEAYPEREADKALSAYTKEGFERTEAAFFAHYQYIFSKIAEEFGALEGDFIALGAVKQTEACGLLRSWAEELAGKNNIYEIASAGIGMDMRLPPYKTMGDLSAEEAKERLSSLKKRFVTDVKYLHETFALVSRDKLERDLVSMYGVAKALIDLCFEFDGEYSALKREENLVDYSDLEHFALELLDKEDVRAAEQAKYSYIFADEYQDTNGVQEEILTRIASDNLFMVGDVKQSIYAFRGCNPAIFERKFARFTEGEGKAISLNSNFRSSDAVLNCVNRLFSEIMTVQTAGTDYRSAPMTGGNGQTGYSKMLVVGKEDDEEIAEKPAKKGVYSVKANLGGNAERDVFYEGVVIASAIREALSEETVTEDGVERKIGYGDVVILCRSMGEYARKLADALADNDVPVSSEVKKQITVYPETRYLISLMRLIDCARQDVPLAAVMRGPIGAFTDGELALIREYSDKNPCEGEDRSFYEAVDFYRASCEGELKDRLDGFFNYVDKLRFLSDFSPAGEILSLAVRENALDLYYLAMPDGQARIKRINKLISEATSGENAYSVREYLSRIDADVDDISIKQTGSTDAVRLMSIHASKGLEFPVVIVAGLDRRFNETDARDEIILDREYGLAIKTYDDSAMRIGTNILCEFLKKRYRSAFVKEEMRILYVALTRAKNRLYLTETADSIAERVSAIDVMDANCYAKLMFSSAVEYKQYTPAELRSLCVERRARNALAGKSDPSLESMIEQSLGFEYRYRTDAPSKSSVTAIAKSASEEQDFVPVLFPSDDSAIEVGNAYHRFMELVDFKKSAKTQLIEQKAAFVEGGSMTEAEAALVDEGKIERILKSQFFSLDARFFRELPFEVLVPTDMLGYGGDADDVLVQGVIDLIAFCEDGIYIADYKVSGKPVDKLKATYAKQLELYAFAASRITGRPVLSTRLFNLKTGEEIVL